MTEASFIETVFAVLEINLPSALKASAVTTRKLTRSLPRKYQVHTIVVHVSPRF